MKKTLLLTALISCGFLLAQSNRFGDYVLNSDLLKVKNSVEQSDKKQFYSQFVKNQLVEEMQKTFTYKKYSPDVLRKFADTIMSYDSMSRISENTEDKLINSLDQLVGVKNNEDKIQENLSYLLGEFPNVVKSADASEHTAYEVIPGEILKIIFWGGGNMTSEIYYKISKRDLENITVIPETPSFLNKVSKNLKNKEVSFFGSKDKSSSDITKDVKNNAYIIDASLYLVDDNFAPLYEIQYTTKDFINFTPRKIKLNEERSKWKMIK